MTNTRGIAVLLSTFNGASFIDIFLNSLSNQSLQDFTLFIRDDGSTDETNSTLSKYSSLHDNIIIVDQYVGNYGPAASFSLLLEHVLEHFNFSYIMFADQDDIWFPDKIRLTKIEMQKKEERYPSKPILVHTDLKVADSAMNLISNSYWKYQKLNPNRTQLNQLLIQNVITGCTVMINKQLALLSIPISNKTIMHDWWLGLVASAFGVISYIDIPTVMYRQHSQNSIGAKKFGVLFIIKRLFSTITLKKHCEQAEAFYKLFLLYLSENQKKMLINFLEIEQTNYFKKIYMLLKYRFLKYGIIRNIGLVLLIRRDSSNRKLKK